VEDLRVQKERKRNNRDFLLIIEFNHRFCSCIASKNKQSNYLKTVCMKNKFLLLAILVFGFATVNAQGGPPQQRTVEERVKTVHEKLDSAFKPGDAKLKEIDDILLPITRRRIN
jgi:hypothetical protein